jgi:hypothetical protein
MFSVYIQRQKFNINKKIVFIQKSFLFQSHYSASSGEIARKEQIYLLANDILKEILFCCTMKKNQLNAHKTYEDSVNTVLVQQCVLYNQLL